MLPRHQRVRLTVATTIVTASFPLTLHGTATLHRAATKQSMDSQATLLHPQLPSPRTIDYAIHPSQDHIALHQEVAADARTDKKIRHINDWPGVV